MSEFGTEKGLLQDHAERQLTHALKSPKLSESFQRSPFLGKFCKLLGITSSVLEFRSWTGKDVPVNLYQRNVFSVLTRKGKIPGHSFHPPRSQSWLRRRISVGSSLGARFPDPVPLSPLREPGTQEPMGPQLPQATQTMGARSRRLHPKQLLPLGRRGRDRGGAPPRPERPCWGLCCCC